MSQFTKYTHLERLGTSDTDGLLQNPGLIIQPKMDGSNASVWFDTNTNSVECGSRKRQVSETKDNAGFYVWVNSMDEEAIYLRHFVEDNPRYRVFGEWMGHSKFIGHIKDYNSAALGKMWIFDVYDNETEHYLADHEWRELLEPYGLLQWAVPVLAVMDYPTVEEIAAVAQENTFMLDNANHKGEGVTIKCPGWINKYGHMVYGKLVLDEFKQSKSAGKPKKSLENPEEFIVAEFVTDSEISKAMAKVAVETNEDFNPKIGKHVGMLLGLVWNDCIIEETKNWLKKTRMATINFKELKKLTDTKVREYAGIGK